MEIYLDFYEILIDSPGKNEFSAMEGSEDFQQFCVMKGNLKQLELEDLRTENQRLAFWINIFNALSLYTFVISTEPKHKNMYIYRFQIGKYHFSLQQIEHAILRGKLSQSFFPSNLRSFRGSGSFLQNLLHFTDPHLDALFVPKKFKSTDERSKFIVEPNPLVNFALNLCTQSSPYTHIYTPEHLNQQLLNSTVEFLSSEVEISKPTSARQRTIITLPKVISHYSKDFGKDARSILVKITELKILEKEQLAEIISLLIRNDPCEVIYTPYCTDYKYPLPEPGLVDS